MQVGTVLVFCQNLKILWHFETFVNTEPNGAENCKTLLLLQFSSDLQSILSSHLLGREGVDYTVTRDA